MKENRNCKCDPKPKPAKTIKRIKPKIGPIKPIEKKVSITNKTLSPNKSIESENETNYYNYIPIPIGTAGLFGMLMAQNRNVKIISGVVAVASVSTFIYLKYYN